MARYRAIAAERAAYLADTATAIGACLDDGGHKNFQKLSGQLTALAEGRDPKDEASTYTDYNVIEI